MFRVRKGKRESRFTHIERKNLLIDKHRGWDMMKTDSGS